MNAASEPRRRQRLATRRSWAIRKDTLFETASWTSPERTGSLKRVHQFATSFVVSARRTSSDPSAGLYSPTSVKLVVGSPASGRALSRISNSGSS